MIINIPEIGDIELKKSQRAKRLIFKIAADGSPKVTVPRSLPLYLAKKYVIKHSDWFLSHKSSKTTEYLTNGMKIGRSHQLVITSSTKVNSVSSRVQSGRVLITYPFNLTADDPRVQEAAKRAATRALKSEAEEYLPSRLYQLANQHGYKYKSVTIRTMSTRWGSCSTNRTISLSIWLMQLPSELIDYVLCHELAHLNNPNHKPAFWRELEVMLPDCKALRQRIREFRPALMIG